jgi:hypothetical protein
MSDSFHSNRDLNIFQATTIAMPINMPIKHRLLTAAANSGSSVKKESTKPKIPVKKIMMTPHPTAVLVAPKEVFFMFCISDFNLHNLKLSRFFPHPSGKIWK